MALREQMPEQAAHAVTRRRPRRGRHRARAGAVPPPVVGEATSHRWTSAESEDRSRRRAERRARLARLWSGSPAADVPHPRKPGDVVGVPAPDVWVPRQRGPRDRAAFVPGPTVPAPPVTGPADLFEPEPVSVPSPRTGTGLLDLARAVGTLTPEVVEGSTAGPALPAAERWAPTALLPDPEFPRAEPVRHRAEPARPRPRRVLVACWVVLALLLVVVMASVPAATRGLGAGAPTPGPVLAEITDQLPDGRAAIAVDAALGQLGVPYQWGGDGPAAGDEGFDCSGLVTFAYAVAGISLPRTAHTQYAAGPHVAPDAPLQPGDLVFYGIPEAVHHVGIYLGEGRMVTAPTFGQPVRTTFYRWSGDDYLGATRPAAPGPYRSAQLEVLPEPAVPDGYAWPRIFPAPPAPPLAERVRPGTDLPPESVTAAAARAAAEGTAGSGRVVGRGPAQPVEARPAAAQLGGGTAAYVRVGEANRLAAGPQGEPGRSGSGPDSGPGDDAAGTAAGELNAGPIGRTADPANPAANPAANPSGDAAGRSDVGPTGVPAGAAVPGSAANPATNPAAPDPGPANPAATPTDPQLGLLVLPAESFLLYPARLDAAGAPVPPAPGTAALLDEGGIQLVVLPAGTALPLDQEIIVILGNGTQRSRTVVEAERLTAAVMAAHLHGMEEGEFQIAVPGADGSWTVAELE